MSSVLNRAAPPTHFKRASVLSTFPHASQIVAYQQLMCARPRSAQSPLTANSCKCLI